MSLKKHLTDNYSIYQYFYKYISVGLNMQKIKSYQQNVGYIEKSPIFATPIQKGGKTADVAQLARARDL